MSRFFIKQISVTGEKVLFSEVSFNDGVNIIYGPSNAGKSYIINCINFMFAGDPPFTKSSTGYDTVTMTMESDDGYAIFMTRKIIDGKNGEVGENSVEVISNYPNVESGPYSISKNEYSDLLLKLMGINEHHKIISTEGFDSQSLGIRTLIHFFFIDEEHIFGKRTVLDSPSYSKINAYLCALNFLLTGDDSMHLMPEETKEERERRITERTGVIAYLNQKIEELSQRKAELEAREAVGETDAEGRIEELLSAIEEIENEIGTASSENRELMRERYEISTKIEEALFLKDRYRVLKSQYEADILRLQFICDGERKEDTIDEAVACPFCNHEIEKGTVAHESYIESSTIEIQRIQLQISDLISAESDVCEGIDKYERKLQEIDDQIAEITNSINGELKPRAAELRQSVEAYKEILRAKQEIYAIDAMATELNTDVFEKENEEDGESAKFKGRELINKDTWKVLSDNLNSMIKECGYPNSPESRLNIDTLDVVVGGKFKKDQGKGYRAYLNTIMLFNLMKYLEENAIYAPHLLILDSPILSLKEKKHKITEKEKATPGMRESLFKYIVNHYGKNQVIIAENEIPEGVDYSFVNLIEYTTDEREGTYGFLKSVKN